METKTNPFADTSTDVVPELRVGKRTCQCTVCGDFFSGPSVFDKHLLRTAHKCRNHEERRAAGMVTNRHGVWLWGTRAVEEPKS
jgi:hypothetical protein